MADEANRPNYFELLEIDPNQPWNEAEFQKRLTVKRADWTNRARHPKYATMYSRYLEMVPKIQVVMADPEQRQQEAKAAKERQSQQQQQKQQQFATDIDYLIAKGFVTEGDVAALVQHYTGVIPESEIRKTIKRRGITVQASKAGEEAAGGLDSATMRSIQTQLDLLAKGDLYTFLGFSSSARTPELLETARQIYDDTQRKAAKTADVTAMSVLAGYAMKVFKNEEERRRYDDALAEQAYEKVLDAPLIRLLQGPDKTLYAGQFQKLLEQARGHHLDVDRAASYIRERARKLGAAIEVTETSAIKLQRACPYCDTLTDAHATACPTCGTPLEMTCPGCGKTIASESNVCQFCRFPVGDIFVIRHQLNDTIDLLHEQRYDLASEKMRHAWFLWGRLPSRKHQNDLTSELEWQFREVEDELQWQKAQLVTLHQHIDQKRFYQAREVLRQLEADWGTATVKIERQTIEQAILATEEKLKRARAASGDEAVQLYLDILAECSDCSEAQEALARIPPAPPSGLVIQQGNEVVSLEWQPSRSGGVHYLVQRKAHTRPVSVNDGTRLATLTSTRFDDASPQIGVPVYYAVYAERGGIYSTDAAVASVPILLVRPVSMVTAGVEDSTVHLAWDTPPNMQSAWVVRASDHYPATPIDGEPVRVLEPTYAVDQGLVNGETYYYTIYSTFLDHEGNSIAGPGAYIAATPQEPPTFIRKLDFEVVRKGAQHELVLAWQPPSKGEVVILRSLQAPPYVETQILPESDLAAHGELLVTKDQRLKTEVEAARIVYFTPIVLFEKMAYIGRTHDYASLEDASNLRAQNLGTELQLRWDWPPNCRKAIVTYSHSDYPSAKEGIRTELTKAQYNLRGYYPIVNPARRDYFIVVFAVIDQNGQELIASGRTARCKISLSGSVSVHYEITRQRRLFGQGELALAVTVEGEGTLPEMVLVQKQGTLPVTKNDGVNIQQIAAGTLDSGKHILPLNGVAAQGFARLFLKDDSFYESQGGHVRIIHPAQEKMRLGN